MNTRLFEEQSIIRLISVADVITFFNALFGILAIIFLIQGKGDITVGTAFIIFALIFDGFDGAAARHFGVKHSKGHALDSFADSISFCIAPSVLIFMVYYDFSSHLNSLNMLVIITSVSVASLGIGRLVKFVRHGYALKEFKGLPTPLTAFMLVILSHLFYNAWYVTLPIALLASFLMVSRIEYPKVRGKVAVMLAIAIIIAVSFIAYQRSKALETAFYYFQIISLLGLSIILLYLIGGPVYHKIRKNQ